MVSNSAPTQGDSVPEGEFMVIKDGPTPMPSSDVFTGKKVVLFGIPGALTPTCSEKQLPGYVEKADEFKAKGVDTIACLAVNDPFVMKEMSKSKDPDGKVMMLGDGAAAFSKAAGIDFDTGNFGGVRTRRCAMIVDDGKVVKIALEEGGAFSGVSSAESMLEAL